MLMETLSNWVLGAPRNTKLAGCREGASMGRTTMTNAPAVTRNAPEYVANTRRASVGEDATTPDSSRQTVRTANILYLQCRLDPFFLKNLRAVGSKYSGRDCF